MNPNLIKRCILCSALIGANASAAVTAYIYQSGANVNATLSGTINTTGLTSAGTGVVAVSPGLTAFVGLLSFGGTQNYSSYTGMVGPANFGPGGATFNATSASGSAVLMEGITPVLRLPAGYISGTSLASSMTWTGQALAGMGVTNGTYTWTWGAGATADSFTLIVGTAPPTPVPAIGQAGLAALVFGLLAATYVLKRRQSRA